MSVLESISQLVEHSPEWAGIAIIGGSACVEYLFPPFPGDLVVVLAGILVMRHHWSAPLAFFAILAGSFVGMLAMTLLGRQLAKRAGPLSLGLERMRPQIDFVTTRFAAHGAFYVGINRFLPSLRALFFVAAGLANLSLWRVLLWGTVSAVLWNAMLWIVAMTVGENWERIGKILRAYSVAATIACIVVIVGYFAVKRLRRGEP